MALNYTNPGWTNDDEPYIDADNLNDISDNLEEACDLIGNEMMGTTATTITGGIKELVTKIGSTVIGTIGTTITSAIKAIQDKLEVVYHSAQNQFSIWYDDNHRLTLNKGSGDDYSIFRVDADNSFISVNGTTQEGLFRVGDGTTNATLSLNPSIGNLSLAHDDNNRMLLNKETTNRYGLFRVDVGGTSYIQLNKTLGVFSAAVESANTHYIYMSNGSSYQEQVLVKCGEQWLMLHPSDGIHLRFASDHYIIINSTSVYMRSGGVIVDLNSSTNRCSITASGGLYVNGSRVGN